MTPGPGAAEAYGLIFLAVFAEQIGLPLPSAPVLIAAGTLAAAGTLDPLAAIVVSLAASLLADSIWYTLGRRYGLRVLRFLCRVSLEPDSCVRRSQDGFARHGAWLVVLAKFVPGLGTVAPPLAGVIRIGLPRFLLLDGAGFLALVLVLMSAGFAFSGPLGRLGRSLAGAGAWAALPVAVVLFAWLAWKLERRRRLLHELGGTRIAPAELKAKLDAGEPVVIIDLRHATEQADGSPPLPGALVMHPDEIEARARDLPRDRDIVLYCT